MALTGLEIFKQLPKTNCKDCGQPTCLAFAMQMASGKAGLDACPHVSDAAREALDSASAPPIALVKIGTGSKAFEVGNETVLFRHDKRFEHATGIAIMVSDTLDAGDLAARVKEINSLVFDRVGQFHGINMVAVDNLSGDPGQFSRAVETVMGLTDYPLLLISENTESMSGAVKLCGSGRPVLCGANPDNYQAMVSLAKGCDAPLVVRGKDLDSLKELVDKIVALGYKNLLLDTGAREPAEVLRDQVQVRRQALKKNRSFGYPTIAFAAGEDSVQDVVNAGLYIAKYAGIVVLATADPADILPLITLRLNIYTDPQKPIAVEPRVYEVGNPGADAPVFITTNFSLTYYNVVGDIEASRVPAYVIPVDTDGTSVLTGWAAGKLTPEKIAEMLQTSGIADRVSHRKVILPGGVAVLSGKLREISGWEVIVGPYESSAIPSFMKQCGALKP